MLESLFDKAADLQDCWKTYLLHADLIFFYFGKTLKVSDFLINYILLKNVKCKVMFTDAYLGPSRTSAMELFCFFGTFFCKKGLSKCSTGF